ncbi:MAG: DUF4345 domain-containing protein [Xanthomonadales bacterium]|nr:DUF4345 domain-containing protein [Xanthomonadales bacterium]
MTLKQWLLVFSFFAVSVVALLYGLSPSWFYAQFLLNSAPPGVDQSHILRAVMTLYLTLGLFWLWAAFSDRYRDMGLLTLCLFCGGLVVGRIISVLVDGLPSPILLVYIFIELSVIPLAIWLLRREH